MDHLSQILSAIERADGLDRRLFLAYFASLASLPLLSSRSRAQSSQAVSFSGDPFQLGVASGDPSASGVVLWTRLAPRPLEPHGGMDAVPVDVTWEVATDEAMSDVVQSGTATAAPQLGHSVHVEVDGLEPERWYWYRFRVGEAETPIARTRTLPAVNASPTQLRFAFASCQQYEHGLYTAYEHMADEDLDLVVHLGDYIYENAPTDGYVRKHLGGETRTLDDYRLRYSQYKSDPLLQGVHARFPWVVTWDDHEVQENYANDNMFGMSPAESLQRRAAAYQAYYEMMPLRAASLPKGPALQLYRKFAFGEFGAVLRARRAAISDGPAERRRRSRHRRRRARSEADDAR